LEVPERGGINRFSIGIKLQEQGLSAIDGPSFLLRRKRAVTALYQAVAKEHNTQVYP
jgi:N-acetyl-anhydromuramyl-L-alanine amidase AmpD